MPCLDALPIITVPVLVGCAHAIVNGGRLVLVHAGATEADEVVESLVVVVVVSTDLPIDALPKRTERMLQLDVLARPPRDEPRTRRRDRNIPPVRVIHPAASRWDVTLALGATGETPDFTQSPNRHRTTVTVARHERANGG